MSIHKPVLSQEIIRGLGLKNGDVVVDATLGGGGHSEQILGMIFPDGKLVAIDRDIQAVENFKTKLKNLKFGIKEENIAIINDNFSRIKEILESLEIFSADKILADFGISSDQLDDPDRGFSFWKESRLDMRMDREGKVTAWDVVNKYEEKKLENIIKKFGEERYARSIVRMIAKERKGRTIDTTLKFAEIIGKSVPRKYRLGKIHCATKTFQAIRMEVNRELEHIEIFLQQSIEVLNKKGRLAVVTFHSGEDRVAKMIFQQNTMGCICPKEFPICRCQQIPKIRIITKKPIIANEKEIKINPRARSAKLRIIEKI